MKRITKGFLLTAVGTVLLSHQVQATPQSILADKGIHTDAPTAAQMVATPGAVAEYSARKAVQGAAVEAPHAFMAAKQAGHTAGLAAGAPIPSAAQRRLAGLAGHPAPIQAIDNQIADEIDRRGHHAFTIEEFNAAKALVVGNHPHLTAIPLTHIAPTAEQVAAAMHLIALPVANFTDAQLAATEVLIAAGVANPAEAQINAEVARPAVAHLATLGVAAPDPAQTALAVHLHGLKPLFDIHDWNAAESLVGAHGGAPIAIAGKPDLGEIGIEVARLAALHAGGGGGGGGAPVALPATQVRFVALGIGAPSGPQINAGNRLVNLGAPYDNFDQLDLDATVYLMDTILPHIALPAAGQIWATKLLMNSQHGAGAIGAPALATIDVLATVDALALPDPEKLLIGQELAWAKQADTPAVAGGLAGPNLAFFVAKFIPDQGVMPANTRDLQVVWKSPRAPAFPAGPLGRIFGAGGPPAAAVPGSEMFRVPTAPGNDMLATLPHHNDGDLVVFMQLGSGTAAGIAPGVAPSKLVRIAYPAQHP